MIHLIKKQQLLLSVDHRLDAFKVQHLASQYYWHTILPALEKIFDNVSNEDEVIELDKLEIDLGSIMEESIRQNEWTSGLQIKLEKILADLLSSSSSNNDAVRKATPVSVCTQWFFYMQHGYIPWNAINIDERWYENVLEALAADYESVTVLRDMIIADATVASRIIFQHSDSFLIHLIEILTAQRQVDLPVMFSELYELFSFMGKQNVLLNPADEKIFKRKLWNQVLNIAAIQQKDLTTAALSKRIITSYIKEPSVLHLIPIELAQKLKIISPVLSALQDELSHFKERQTGEIQPVEEKSGKRRLLKHEEPIEQARKKEDYNQINEGQNKIDLIKDERGKDASKEAVEPSTQDSRQKKSTDDLEQNKESTEESGQIREIGITPDENKPSAIDPGENKSSVIEIIEGRSHKQDAKTTNDRLLNQNEEVTDNLFGGPVTRNKEFDFKVVDEEGIFVHHAGIVLIHPFLTTLFKRLQLTEENRFVDPVAPHKALHLLHYLGTGNAMAEEYELVIPRLLCNHSLDEPVPKEINLTAIEQLEADDMLKAAILQWDKIKNTSVEGFRESFLQRKGKLFMKNSVPHLQVETHSIDVLLDYLPWNLGIIKLPWMKEMLHVEWR